MRRLIFAALLMIAGPAMAQAPAALPAGPGRAETLRVCTGCHEAEVLIHRSQKLAAWSDIVQAMLDKGAQASAADQAAIVAYLQKALPPQAPTGR